MKKAGVSAIEIFKYKMLLLGMINILVLSLMSGILGAGYLGISFAILIIFISFHSAAWPPPINTERY